MISPNHHEDDVAILDSKLQAVLAKIKHTDKVLGQKAIAKIEKYLPPKPHSLGLIPDILARYINIRQEKHPTPQKTVIISCADHGVSEETVSAYPPETTLHMLKNYLIAQGAAANAMANFVDADLVVADLGVAADTAGIPDLIHSSIAKGTKNITKEAAMTRAEAIRSIITGVDIATACAKRGDSIILPGEMGISNTTSSAAIVAAILGLSAEEVTGRGANISDSRLAHKVNVVRRALAVNQPNPLDALDVLSKVGGFEFGCIAGLILGAAINRQLVVLDGANTAAAALIAHTLNPAVSDYLFASHQSVTEKSQAHALKRIGLTPYMVLDIRLSEAAGAAIATTHLEAMLYLWKIIDKKTVPRTEFGLCHMPRGQVNVTNKTFGFYLDTISALDNVSMNACSYRIDNLAKPIHSLGYLEQIAMKLAGIMGDECPGVDIPATLILFSPDKLSSKQEMLTHAFTDYAGIDVMVAELKTQLSPTSAFNFGRELAEEKSLLSPIIALSIGEFTKTTPLGDFAERLNTLLLNADDSLKYSPETFLRQLPETHQSAVAAVIGAIIAAAHNNSMILLDDEATEIIARYLEQLVPSVRPYILHIAPAMLKLNTKVSGGLVSSLGMSIIRAALYMLNDMKTFAETGVAVANDGPGVGRQVNK